MARYSVTYNMQEQGLSTLFKYRIFTIMATDRMNWDYDNLDQYLIDYEFVVSSVVMQKYAGDMDVTEILTEMMQDKCYFRLIITRPKDIREVSNI